MGLFGKPKTNDPFSSRAKALTAEIASLEARIKDLDQKVHGTPAQPRLRSTARPGEAHGAAAQAAPAREPVFEQVNHQRVTAPPTETGSTPAHYNELGVRKFDLPAAWARVRRHFEGPPASNPKLVNYLAAGSIQGLRPLRYEKRVARNRVIALAIILVIVLWGLAAVFVK